MTGPFRFADKRLQDYHASVSREFRQSDSAREETMCTDAGAAIDACAVNVRQFGHECPRVRAPGGRPTLIGNEGLNTRLLAAAIWILATLCWMPASAPAEEDTESKSCFNAPAQSIANDFGGHYVLTDLNHKSFLRQAQADPYLEEVYRDEYTVIFRVLNQVDEKKGG